jgi:hypothetical protein
MDQLRQAVTEENEQMLRSVADRY